MASSSSDWLLSHAAQRKDLGRTWTASAVVLLPIHSSTAMDKRPSVILPTPMTSKNGYNQSYEDLRRRLCKPISSSVKGACSRAREEQHQQQFLSPTIVDTRSITQEEFNKMAAVSTGKVTKGRDRSSSQPREFLHAGQVFLTQNNMNTGFAFASSAPFLKNVSSYEKHPPESIQESLASLKKGLVDYLSRAKTTKEKGLTEAERPKVSVEAAWQSWSQNGRVRGKPFSCSTKGAVVPAATIKPLPSTARNDDVIEYHVASKPQPYPGPRTIHKKPNAELEEIKPMDLSRAGKDNYKTPCSDNQASLKEKIHDLKEKILETEKCLQNMEDDGSEFSQQQQPIDLTVIKKPKHVDPTPYSTTDLINKKEDCLDNSVKAKRSLRASTKTNTLATENSFLQDKNRKRKRKRSHTGKASVKSDGLTTLPDSRSTPEQVATTGVPIQRNTKHIGNNGIYNSKVQYNESMQSLDKSDCPTAGKRGRLDEMVQALSKRLHDAHYPWYGLDYR
ncbi:uncharacterized protein LOC118427562 isoform X1 [Branchiostoma floridae]|uniref:Uncharacterized protein LOC118427562 isoform X1 n=2 Tax=Branchiostoma floridae TaxID=7739 RepID=A0A9J7N6K8_BRAFL|nr:uncharacterized protein LOC118427562 isoform X1 [Branchiostoma floridae]